LCRLDYWSHGSARLVGLTVTEMRTSVSGASFSFRMILCVVVPVGNSRSDILVVQSAQNWHGQRLTDCLDGSRDRRVLLQ
jgi:hypothetical protein